ncbi:MAG: EAL domain-containing protein, partial [Betaproteobacteria bacterium]
MGAVNMVDLSPPLLLDKYYSQGERGEGDEFSLSSHFQPIYSLTHRRPIGYEGLIRAVHSASGRRVEPLELFSTAPRGEARIRLDRQCRALHVRNFQRLGNTRSWLFLNVDPRVASESLRYAPFFLKMLQSNGFPTHRVAVELIETPFE